MRKNSICQLNLFKGLIFLLLGLLLFSHINAFSQKKASATTEGYIVVDKDIQLFYQIVGNGSQTVVVPMGFLLYDDFKQLAGKNHRFIFYDMRNRARSSSVSDTAKISLEADIADLEKVRAHFGVRKMYLIGSSYLGLMVAAYTAKYPQYVQGIVQIAPAPFKSDTIYPAKYTAPQLPPDTLAFARVEKAFNDEGYEKDPKAISILVWNEIVRRNLVADSSYYSKIGKQFITQYEYPNEWFRNSNRHFKYLFKTIQEFQMSEPTVKAIKCPVLVIHGTIDRNVPYGVGRHWASLLPNGRLLTVNGAAHLPWIEHPEIIFPAIKTFLQGKWPESVEIVEDLN